MGAARIRDAFSGVALHAREGSRPIETLALSEMRRTPYCHERHGCSQLLGFVRPKWQRRGGAASGSFGDDARNLLRLRLVSPKLWRDHSYLSLGFVRPQRHLVLAERVVLAERALGSFGQHRMHWVAPAWVRSGESCSGGRNGSGSFGQGV